MKRLILIILSVLIIGAIALEVISRQVIPFALIQPLRNHLDQHPSDFGLKSTPLELQTADSLQLNGHWINAKTETPKGVFIFIHGIGGCKEHFLHPAAKMAELGYASVIMDLRAHGESGGQFTTYGYYEKRDMMLIVDHIKAQNDSIPIGIWGHSLGGAIAIQTMAEDPRIDFGIIESTFRDLEEIMIDYQRRMVDIPFGHYMGNAMTKAEELANFKIEQVKPIESVKLINKPVLIAHGTSDFHISVDYGRALYEELASTNKEWISVEGAEHNNLREVAGEDYFNRILGFINGL